MARFSCRGLLALLLEPEGGFCPGGHHEVAPALEILQQRRAGGRGVALRIDPAAALPDLPVDAAHAGIVGEAGVPLEQVHAGLFESVMRHLLRSQAKEKARLRVGGGPVVLPCSPLIVSGIADSRQEERCPRRIKQSAPRASLRGWKSARRAVPARHKSF